MRRSKNLALLIATVIVVLPFINGCKKGEHDPFISLKSRNARITGKWKLTKIEGTEVEIWNGTSTTYTYSYDGTTYSVSGGSHLYSGTGSYEMTINKDGKMSYYQSFTESGSETVVFSGEGYWFWSDSDEKKLFICLIVEYVGFDTPDKIFYVDKLSSKELILKYTKKEVYNDNSYSCNITYTFEKQ